jgi:hypothetical protein
VPLESAEETVLSDGPEGRVVERLVKKFDSQGRLTGQEKVRVEATSSGDGSSPSGPRFYDRDLNGLCARETARRPSPARTSAATRAETVIERPNVNGNLDPQERKLSVTTAGDDALGAQGCHGIPARTKAGRSASGCPRG